MILDTFRACCSHHEQHQYLLYHHARFGISKITTAFEPEIAFVVRYP